MSRRHNLWEDLIEVLPKESCQPVIWPFYWKTQTTRPLKSIQLSISHLYLSVNKPQHTSVHKSINIHSIFWPPPPCPLVPKPSTPHCRGATPAAKVGVCSLLTECLGAIFISATTYSLHFEPYITESAKAMHYFTNNTVVWQYYYR